MKSKGWKKGLRAAAAAMTLLSPAIGWAQGAPASWAGKQGRWEGWKDGAFATSSAHFEALKAAAKGGVALTARTTPDWSGLWMTADSSIAVGLGWSAPGIALGWGAPRYRYTAAAGLTVNPPGIPGQPPLPPDTPRPERPVLTPAAEEALIKSLRLGSEAWDYIYDCLPAGFPRWYTEPYLREFVVTPKQTWMINEFESEVRRIYTDGRGHVPEAERYPLWEGDSIGFWDGDTLVVHTISLKSGNWNKNQPPYSDQIETVELIRKDERGMVESRMTVYDPVSLQRPWRVIWGSQKADLSRTPNMRLNQSSCSENNNFVPAPGGGVTALLPGQQGYREPSNTRVFSPDSR